MILYTGIWYGLCSKIKLEKGISVPGWSYDVLKIKLGTS